ncbi:hypothetical protein HYW75_06480 [Candidatus Pacearchaeota archaeon]|nr:hypothetical protein [Candidatus Pacearchaeota archaeon]
MGKIKEAVFDAGPFIHLSEINQLELIKLFSTILTTSYILEECKHLRKEIIKFKHIQEAILKSTANDFVKYLVNRYNIDFGEATGISLCKQERIKLFFTDDLEARDVAYNLGFEAHGTISIILRTYKENIISKKETIELIEKLYKGSSLYLSKDLKDWIINEIGNFK